MKPVQIMMEPDLLEALDTTEEVRMEGRSAVVRRAVAQYLDRVRRMEIRESYERAYGDGADLDEELGGWVEEGVWPDG